MALRKIADDIWVAEDELNLGPVVFPVRMTVIRLENGELLLHSVVNINGRLASEIEALGPVKWIVAPNTYHHVFIPQAVKRYPDAQLWLAKGLHKKRSDLEYTGLLDESTPAPWGQELPYLKVDGIPGLNEVVLFHKASQSLIVCDLVFNNRHPKGIMTHIMMLLAGTHKRLGQSRLVRFAVKDRAAAGDSCRRILSWPFTRLIMAHGTIIEEDARSALAGALSWMLNDGAYQLPPIQPS